MSVKYFGSEVDVQLGDRVSVRVWFRKRCGRVVYLPGVSPRNSEFDYNGLQWAGIRLDDGSLLASVVRFSTGSLKRKVKFIKRDGSACKLIGESSNEFEEHGEGLAI